MDYKEMTIEEKAKAYDEALERAKRFMSVRGVSPDEDAFECVKELSETIFPELKESEDEKIRKEIIHFLEIISNQMTQSQYFDWKNKWLPWLEKQGEQKSIDKIQIGKKYKCIASPRYSAFMTGEIYKPEDKFLCSLMNFCSDCFEPIEDGEQKPADGQKFKVGDWLVHKDMVGVICCITQIHAPHYYLTNNNSFIKFGEEDNYRPWTIQDAKDGDVLNSVRVQATIIFKGFADDGKHILAYCALQKGIFISQEMFWDRDFEPASEDWKNALYDAMSANGYEWDAEKKELRKIVQESTWNEKIKGLNELETYILSLVPDSPLDAIKVYAKSIRYIINKEQKPAKTAIDAWKEMRLEVYAQASGNRHEPNCSDYNSKMFSLNDIDEIFEKVSDCVVEQKPVTHKYNVGATIYYKSFGKIKSMVVANVIDTGDGNPMYEDKDGNDVFEKDLILQMHVEEQKPAEWSEEDIKTMRQIIRIVKDSGCSNRCYDRIAKFMNSITPNLQPKQEWSEDDEKMIENIIETINIAISDCDVDDIGTRARFSLEKERDWLKNKLKSLKPYNTWKPSDEQMENLSRAVNGGTYRTSLLMELYQDLKKMKE